VLHATTWSAVAALTPLLLLLLSLLLFGCSNCFDFTLCSPLLPDHLLPHPTDMCRTSVQ
jgi:hypothetical protein